MCMYMYVHMYICTNKDIWIDISIDDRLDR